MRDAFTFVRGLGRLRAGGRGDRARWRRGRYGLVAGFTQTQTSQILGFAPGQQVMIENAQAASSGVPHTLGDTDGLGSFPQSANLSSRSNTPANGTFGAGFQSGTIDPGSMVGSFKLSTGSYFIGCLYHYASKAMSDVLLVAADAHPGSAGTPPPGDTPPPSAGGY